MKKILSKRLKMIDSQGMKNRKEDERFYIADDIATFTCFCYSKNTIKRSNPLDLQKIIHPQV